MKAIVVESFGGPEHLVVEDVADPQVGAGQVLVAVEAAGVGLADALMRQGLDPSIQAGYIPGLEAAGTVAEVGPGVDAGWAGSRVFTMAHHENESRHYAQYLVADVASLVPVPAPISSATAVALGINALVGHFAVQRARLQAGERALVRGASGGIGVMATQLAALTGAAVTVATSSEERGERLRTLGASEVLDRLGATFAGDPAEEFDVIIDPAGGPEIPRFLQQLARNGRMVACGAGGGFPSPDFAMQVMISFAKSLTFSMLSLSSIDVADLATGLREIFALASDGKLQPVVHRCFPLEEAAAAHAMLESGEVFGKLVLEVGR